MTSTGTDPDGMVLWARLTNGERYDAANGGSLVEIAEAAAGIAARPRVARE